MRPPALESFRDVHARLVSDVPSVRWAPAESAHITLHFFGSIGAAEFARALAALRPVITAHPPMLLRLRGLGSFPSTAEPRVLWFGVDGDSKKLTAVALACSAALHAAGFAVEDRPYRAHCTLGRPRSPWPPRARESWRRLAQEDPCTPSFIADTAILYESLMETAGVVHVPREVLTLGGGSAQPRTGQPLA